MKNNKGFAISTIMYALLVLFVVILTSLLGVLSTRNILLDRNKKQAQEFLNGIDNKIEPTAGVQTVLYRESNSLPGRFFITESTNIECTVNNTIYTNTNVLEPGTYELSCSIKYNGARYGTSTTTLVVLKEDAKLFEYTGDYQVFKAEKAGYYRIELWGASGGYAQYNSTKNLGGNGAYTKGTIYLDKNEEIYVYVGGEGVSITGTATFTKYDNGNGYNGGKSASSAVNNSCHGGGGGATDVRLVPGLFDNAESLNSRIMVAGGGGGAATHSQNPNYSGNGGNGQLIGGKAIANSQTCYAYGAGGTQITGGNAITCATNGHDYSAVATFGIGSGENVYHSNEAHSGGAGGYYGGGGGRHAPAGGGSSFISGYAGVDAITAQNLTNNPRTHTGNTLHYSNRYFINGNVKGGINTGNGKAVITYVSGNKPERVNSNLDNVRYIKDCISGNTVNVDNHWVELQAIIDGLNVAKGKTVTGTKDSWATRPYSRITDGDITSSNWAESSATGLQCITVDLGSYYNLDEIAVWHYYTDNRTYLNNITYTSSDNINWNIVINKQEAETVNGKRVNAYEKEYRTGTSEEVSTIYFNPMTNEECTYTEYLNNANKLGNSGCMKWYATENSGSDKSTVDVILDHNTSNGVAWNSSNDNTTMKEVKTQLAADISTWHSDVKSTARLIKANEVADIVGARGADSTKSEKFDVATTNSNGHFYFDGSSGKDTTWRAQVAKSRGASDYAWVYNNLYNCENQGCEIKTTISSGNNGYWTQDAIYGSSTLVWGIRYYGYLGYPEAATGTDSGVRPVITINKNRLSKYQTYKTGTKDVVSAIYFNPKTNTKCTETDYNNNTNKLGNDGCMKWYAIENSGSSSSTVDVILDHNTSNGIAWNSSNSNTEMKEAKTQLATDSSGWHANVKSTARLIKANEVAEIVKAKGAGSTKTEKFASSTTTYDKWFYFDGADGTATNWQTQVAKSKGASKYTWLYNNLYDCENQGCDVLSKQAGSWGYWTQNAVNDISNRAWFVYYWGGLGHGNLKVDNVGNSTLGIRPVITIDKNVLD